MERHRLRTTFEEVPDLYDRARPTYPPELFDDLVALARIPDRGRVLELGPGTGQATVPLAERGFEVLAIELGESMAAYASRKLARFPNVRIVHSTFEAWEPGDARFDAVVAFTAFHWIDPEERYAKPARLLRPEGALAVVTTQHVSREGGGSFWVDVQDDYDAVVPDPANRPPPPPDELEGSRAEIEASRLFVHVEARRYLWGVTYTADEYIAVLNTYSGHRSIEEPKRLELYDRIHRRVVSQPGGVVHKTYLALLDVARVR